MIVVTRLNDSQFAINPDLIERIHSNPDTTLVLVDGAKFIVTESMAEVIDRISRYRATVLALTQELAFDRERPDQRMPTARVLGLVENFDHSARETNSARETHSPRPNPHPRPRSN